MPSPARLWHWAVAALFASTSTALRVPTISELDSRMKAMVGGNVTLRIMPLGSSIPFGVGSSDGNGYRQHLRERLVNDGNPVEYVGSWANGTMSGNHVEGWPGYRISQVAAKANFSVHDRLPNLVLITAGTNDCLQDHEVETAGERMGSLLDSVAAASSRVTIVLSTLPVNANPRAETCIQNVNQQFRRLVEDQQARSKKVVLADFHSNGGPTLDDLVDGTNPNDEGYRKMAPIWFAALEDAASRGWLQSPQSLENRKC